jgi:hypothetical protein
MVHSGLYFRVPAFRIETDILAFGQIGKQPRVMTGSLVAGATCSGFPHQLGTIPVEWSVGQEQIDIGFDPLGEREHGQ